MQIPTQPDPQNGVEVLARGPIHEAFATTAEMPLSGGPIIPKVPPEPIEELPPDQKPDGDNVQWVPGYWSWDEDRSDYIWVSGFWRQPPPGHLWVPGNWHEVQGGFQWVQGFWQPPQIQQAALQYLPPPPQPIETAPSVPAPSETHVYVPGSWVWRTRYVWRPGFWMEQNPNWIWVPAHYRWTPAGYIFVDGYWDMPLAHRGVLFAPVYVAPGVIVRRNFVYTPTIVVSEPALYTSLFIRRGWGSYYFGDYFERRYVDVGYTAWCGTIRTNGFAVSVGFGARPIHDPLWDYYRVNNRHDTAWVAGVHEVYTGRFNGTVARPPRTLVQQNTVINNVTNVTNITNNTNVINQNTKNITVNNKTINNNTNMLTTLNNAAQTNPSLGLKSIPKTQQAQEQKYAQELRSVSAQRAQVERNMVSRGQTAMKPSDAPVSAKLDMPKQAVTRAQIPDAKPNTSTLTNTAPVRTNTNAGTNPGTNPNLGTPAKTGPSIAPLPKGSTNPQPQPGTGNPFKGPTNPAPLPLPNTNTLPKGPTNPGTLPNTNTNTLPKGPTNPGAMPNTLPKGPTNPGTLPSNLPKGPTNPGTMPHNPMMGPRQNFIPPPPPMPPKSNKPAPSNPPSVPKP